MVLGTIAWLALSSLPPATDEWLQLAQNKVEALRNQGLICDESYELYTKRPLLRVDDDREWSEKYANEIVTIEIIRQNRKVTFFRCKSSRKPNATLTGNELLALARKTLAILDNTGSRGSFRFQRNINLEQSYENPTIFVEKEIDGVAYAGPAQFRFDTGNRHLELYSNKTNFIDPNPKPVNVAPDEESAILAMNFVASQPGVRFVEASSVSTAIGSPGPMTRNGFDFRDNFPGLYDRTKPSYFRGLSVYELNTDGG